MTSDSLHIVMLFHLIHPFLLKNAMQHWCILKETEWATYESFKNKCLSVMMAVNVLFKTGRKKNVRKDGCSI